jgi:hypothetical protein
MTYAGHRDPAVADPIVAVEEWIAIIVLNPNATDTTTPGTYLVKDPDPGDAPVLTPTVPGNAKNGWKAYSFIDLATAYFS